MTTVDSKRQAVDRVYFTAVDLLINNPHFWAPSYT
jgi:hypothetical protein